MKKQITLIFGGVLLFGLLFTGCIKNEESDGVKALRMAQASLIQAKADHESAIIAADVAYEEAQAAMAQASADIQRAAADLAIANSEIDIAIAQGSQQAKLNKAVADAEIALATSKKNLESALRDLEKEIAKSEVENPTLDEYMAKYKTTIAKIEDLQGDIINKQKEINEKNIAISFGGAKQAVLNDLAQATRDLVKAEDLKTKYTAASIDPTTLYASLNDAEVALEVLETQKINLGGKLDKATVDFDNAMEKMFDAGDQYDEVKNGIDLVNNFTSKVGFSETIDGEFFIPGATSGNYNSLVDYDEDIADKQEELADMQLKLTSLNALHTAYKNALTAKQNTRKTKLAAYRSAVQAYNVALLAAGGDATAAPVVTADGVKTTALNEYNTADGELTNLKNDIAGAAIDFGLIGNPDWDDKFYIWVGNNDEEIEDLIADFTTNDIPTAQDDLAEVQFDRAVVVSFIDLLETDFGATAANLATIETAFHTAKDSWIAAAKVMMGLQSDLNDLELDIELAEAVADALDDDYSALISNLDDINDDIALLKDAVELLEEQVQNENITDVDFLNGELEVLQLEVAHLQEQLTVEKSSAARYLQLITEEIGS